MSKTIAIIGINSRQGRAVAQSLLKEGKWKVKGLARDAEKAKDLAEKGVEIVQVNMDDAAQLQKELAGIYS